MDQTELWKVQYKDEQHWKSKARKYFGDKKLSSTTATEVKKERFMNPNYLVISPPPISQKVLETFRTYFLYILGTPRF